VDELLELLDWKRRVFELYAEVRAAEDPAAAWLHWRAVRDGLIRTHPQSPRPGYDDVAYFDYDPALRVLADVAPVAGESLPIAGSAQSSIPSHQFAVARFELPGEGPVELQLYWLEAYGGGVFLPFADATSGSETYGGGRYLLDTVKGSDLGMDGDRLVLDFNFAYNPSCSYDDRWACPLAPPANRLGFPVRGGELAPRV
jgi:uncharacterized protein